MTDERKYTEGGYIPGHGDDPIITYDPERDGPLIHASEATIERAREIMREMNR